MWWLFTPMQSQAFKLSRNLLPSTHSPFFITSYHPLPPQQYSHNRSGISQRSLSLPNIPPFSYWKPHMWLFKVTFATESSFFSPFPVQCHSRKHPLNASIISERNGGCWENYGLQYGFSGGVRYQLIKRSMFVFCLFGRVDLAWKLLRAFYWHTDDSRYTLSTTRSQHFHQAPETNKHGDICNHPPFNFTPLMLWEQADTC